MGRFSGYQYRTGYREKIFARDNHTCQVCGAPAQEIDHIVPWRIKHDNSEANLRAVCIKCNHTGAPRKLLPLDQWFASLEAQMRQT